MSSKNTTIIIPNDLCRRSGIAATCFPINNFSIFPSQLKKTYQKDTKSHFYPINAPIFIVRQDVVLFNDVLRKLINESNGIFLNLQSLMISKRIDRLELVQVSLQYRSVIRECLENLQDELSLFNVNKKDDLESLIMIFYSVECIWHLCEILFILKPAHNDLLSNILNWVSFHFPKYERKSTEFLNLNSLNIENHPDYWQTIIGCLLQGKIEISRALLHLNPHFSSSIEFETLDLVLKTFPMPTKTHKIANTEYNLRFKHWQVETQAKIDAKMFVGNKNLEFIARLVVGDEIAWFEVQNQCETWYEFLAGWLVFNEPSVKSFELGTFAKRCITIMGVKDKMKYLDRVLLAAMNGDVLQVIKEAQHMTENGWFVTHLTDLLYHSGCLENVDKSDKQKNLGDKLRESFLLEYGSLMTSHSSLWQLGLTYLDYCPTDGINAITLLLPRIKSTNEAKTRKIIKEALKRELSSVAHSICKIQGKIALTRQRPGTALTWALKSQDANFASQVADKFLIDYIKSGELKNCDLLDHLGQGMLVSDRLTFLGKYSEFHKLYGESKYKEAGNLLISLISSRITPKYFWSTLFIDSLPLLESDVLVFSSNDTFTLLHFLEEKPELLSFGSFGNKIDLIRLALARNLGRALTYEAQNLAI